MKVPIVRAIEKNRVIVAEKSVQDPTATEIQVRVRKTLISPGTERAIITASANTGQRFPRDMGYSAAGTVEKVGRECTRFKPGDRVACFCLNHTNLGNAQEEFCMPVPDGITFEQAAFLALGVICLQGVRKPRIEIGEAVMVLGLGPIGQLAIQLARANGALPTIGIDRIASRLELARSCGADIVLNTQEQDWEEKLKDATDGQGPHVVVESTGFPEPVNLAFKVIRKFGRVSLLGSTRQEATLNLYHTIHRKALSVVGAHIMGNPNYESRPGFWTWLDDAAAFLRLLEHGRVRVKPLITDRVPWQEAEGLYRRLLEGDMDMMVPMINWD